MEISIGKGMKIEVDRAKFTPEVNDHIWVFGIRQMLADAHAGMGKHEDDYVNKSRVLAERKLAALYSGELRVNGERGPRRDSLDAECRHIALGQVHAKIKAGKYTVNGVPITKVSSFKTETILQMVEARIAENPKILVQAKIIVAAREEAE